MSWNTPDVYYNPEHFGLAKLIEADDPDACYSFDIICVWKHADGRLFYAEDSGCSCPSPFEDYTSLDGLTLIEPHTFGRFATEVDNGCWSATDKVEILAAVSAELKARGQ